MCPGSAHPGPTHTGKVGPPSPGCPSLGTYSPKPVGPESCRLCSSSSARPMCVSSRRLHAALPPLRTPQTVWPLPLYFPPPTGHSPQAVCHPPTPARVGPPSSPRSPVCLCDLSLPVPILAGRTGSPTLPGPGQPPCPTSVGQAGPSRAPPSASHHTFLTGFEAQVQAPSPL